MGSRRQAREASLQVLYLCDICDFEPDSADGAMVFRSLNVPDSSCEFAEKLISGTWAKKKTLDAIISRYAENWELDRMAAIDRNILRQAAFEITDMPETPLSVIIDEAVEIAKKFSTADSGKFVNGILDKLKSART